MWVILQVIDVGATIVRSLYHVGVEIVCLDFKIPQYVSIVKSGIIVENSSPLMMTHAGKYIMSPAEDIMNTVTGWQELKIYMFMLTFTLLPLCKM